jgi:nitroreductase
LTVANDALTYPTDTQTLTRALVEAAAAAGYAPSIHNTQPWRWRLIGRVLDLHLERDRVLDVTDPDTRLATLSCGAALHHARVTLAAQGWRVTVVRLPDRADPDHLAQVHVEGRAPLDPPSILDLRTIPLRHTDRRQVTGEPVGPEQMNAITAAVTTEGTWLHTLTRDQVLDLTAATDHAQCVEADEPAWQAELGYWTGGDWPAGTGIRATAIPDRATRTTVPGRDFGHHGELPVSAAHDEAAVFVMLYGRTDTPLDWLRAGEALSSGWLVALQRGVCLLPHSVAIETVGTRQAMRVMLASTGHPYLLLRLGRIDPADPGPPHAPRLPAEQIIERS